MRSVFSISLPREKAERIKNTIEKRWFKSISEYLVYSSDFEQSFISEDEIFKKANEAQKAYDEGNIYSWINILKSRVKKWK